METALTTVVGQGSDRPLTDAELRDRRQSLRKPYIERESDARLREHLETSLADLEDETRRAGERSGGEGGSGEHDSGARMLAVTGRTGAGKSRAVRRLLASTTGLEWSECGRIRPLIRLSVEAPATLKSVGLDLLGKLNYSLSAQAREAVVWRKVRDHLRKARTRAVFLDEFQNCSSRANEDEAIRIRDTLRSLLVSDHPVVLVVVGLPEIVSFLRKDGQVRRRGLFTSLESLDVDDADHVTNIVTRLAARVNMMLAPDFGTEVAPRLLHASSGQLGLAVEMSVEAILQASRPSHYLVDADGAERKACLAPRSELLLEDFTRMYEARTNNEWFANPFHASVEDWSAIDPTLVGVHLPSQMEREGEGKDGLAPPDRKIPVRKPGSPK